MRQFAGLLLLERTYSGFKGSATRRRRRGEVRKLLQQAVEQKLNSSLQWRYSRKFQFEIRSTCSPYLVKVVKQSKLIVVHSIFCFFFTYRPQLTLHLIFQPVISHFISFSHFRKAILFLNLSPQLAELAGVLFSNQKIVQTTQVLSVTSHSQIVACGFRDQRNSEFSACTSRSINIKVHSECFEFLEISNGLVKTWPREPNFELIPIDFCGLAGSAQKSAAMLDRQTQNLPWTIYSNTLESQKAGSIALDDD